MSYKCKIVDGGEDGPIFRVSCFTDGTCFDAKSSAKAWRKVGAAASRPPPASTSRVALFTTHALWAQAINHVHRVCAERSLPVPVMSLSKGGSRRALAPCLGTV